MNLRQLLERWRASPDFATNVTAWREIPERPARYVEFPAGLDPRLAEALRGEGIERLYTHQARAWEEVRAGNHVVVVTPTASGKSLCYHLPVLDTILKDPEARALYLFPTKALSQDQSTGVHRLIERAGIDVKAFTYDGDTPLTARKLIRLAGHLVVTNPDMLHTGILPHHARWVRLFENLRYVVLDELHHYRGVFGSHVANVIRRLKRIAAFYGSSPLFICSSATIANPRELASRLLEEEVALVDDNGAPTGAKHFIFYNPPVVNRELGIRRSVVLESSKIAAELVANNIATIVFARARVTTEVLLTYLREAVGRSRVPARAVRGYRGGYLPRERRAIEQGLRDGSVRGVVSTNALELGIDIGSLEAAVMVGYPGTISSTWQQAGRSGRRQDVSAAVLVASSSPLDQYLVVHPEYFFTRSPEHGLISPDNLLVLLSHLKCAAFELPFRAGEPYGGTTRDEVLDYLAEEKVLHREGDSWYWMSDAFPAEEISLRTAASENFVVVDITEPRPRLIGEVDRFAAPMLLHEDAIYIHEGRQYQVERLDWDGKKAYTRAVDADYYTDASLAVTVRVLEETSPPSSTAPRHHGEVSITSLVTMFKKIKLHTHENVGWGKVHLPELEMHTSAYWLVVPEDVAATFTQPRLQGSLLGLANVLGQVAPLYLMCDPRDLGVVCEVRSSFTQRSTIFLYDSYPGGIGLSAKLFEIHPLLLAAARDVIADCGCDNGCPSCVGPASEVGDTGKTDTLALAGALLALS